MEIPAHFEYRGVDSFIPSGLGAGGLVALYTCPHFHNLRKDTAMKQNQRAAIALCLYVGSIIVLNIAFSYVPMVDLGFGLFSPMAILAGAVFVIRDYAQREAGHWVLAGMVAGAIASFVLADPYVAWASVAAFAIAESTDYILYTVTKRPFKDRVLISSIVSTPVDTFVFLALISGLTTGTFILMIIAKMIAALVIWSYYNRRPMTA